MKLLTLFLYSYLLVCNYKAFRSYPIPALSYNFRYILSIGQSVIISARIIAKAWI